MNTKLLPWIIAGIFLVWAVIASTCSGSDDQNDKIVELQTKIKTRDAAIHEMGRNYTALRTKMRQDSILYAEVVDSVAKKNVALTSNIKILRATPRVIEIVKQNPVIDTIFTYYDSVTTAQNFIIYSQQKQIAQMQVDINEIERNFEHRLQLQGQSLEDYRTLSDEYKKDLRKKRRQARLAKVLIPVVAVGAFLAGTSL